MRMRKEISFLTIAIFLSACDVRTSGGPSGWSAAREDIERWGGCSLEIREKRVKSLRMHRVSEEYISGFASSYGRACDEHARTIARRRSD